MSAETDGDTGDVSDAPGEVSALLGRVEAGDEAARERLLDLVYRELHAIARGLMRNERPGHTLQATAVVNEAYLKLFARSPPRARDRAYFFAAAARAMRQVLVDHARRRAAAKRPDPEARLPLDELLDGLSASYGVDMIWLDDALAALARFGRRQHDVVMLRFFAGLTHREIADQLGVSLTTVEKDWRAARAWLHARLRGDPS